MKEFFFVCEKQIFDHFSTFYGQCLVTATGSPWSIYLLVMPKYWGKQIFSLGSFPEAGQKQKTEKKIIFFFS